MARTHDTEWERALARLARRMEYPATPDVAAAVRSLTAAGAGAQGRRGAGERRSLGGGQRSAVGRRMAWAVVVMAVIVAAILAVPQTRAAVLRLFARIGAIEIFIDEAAPTLPASTPPTPPPTALPAESGGIVVPPSPTFASTVTPRPTAETVGHSLLLFDLGAPATLEEVARGLSFTPAVPTALGEPDEAYDHRRAGQLPAVTLVWRDVDPPLTLTEIGIEEYARKFVAAGAVRDVTVNDRPAVWIEGPHVIQLLGNLDETSALITSNVLIWSAGGLTYRLEGGLSEEEMIAIAESLPVTATD